MAEDLVRRIRFDVTRSNLERINKLAKTIERREAGVGDFLKLPERLQEAVRPLVESANNLNQWALDDFRDDADGFRDGLKDLRNGIESLQTALGKERKAATRLQDQLFEPLSGADVEDYLVRAAGEMRRKLTQENYWDDRAGCESLFSEYVELLRGFALRSARFGDDEDLSIGDLFLIADALPGGWGRIGGWRWQSVAVPSRLDQSRSTEAMVLRVGFPEWSVWALPLLQHEFGHIVVKRMRLDSSGADPAVLADALAALVGGPAYACATLLLRLDPAAVDHVPPEAAFRSATIINSLRAIAEEAEIAPVVKLAERLEHEWRIAVRDAGGSAEALAEALASSAWKTALDTARSTVPGLAKGEGGTQPRWAEKWTTVSTWADRLKDGKTDAIDLAELDGKDEQRPSLNLVLNAAWLARVRPNPAHDADEREVEAVGRNAGKRMLEYVRAPVRTETKLTSVRA